jgi:hypothetical protein
MTQDDRWEYQYNQMMTFMNKHHKRPSKYYGEELAMHNWFKYNKKQLAKGLLPDHRIKKFKKLLEMANELRRINQYA